MAGFDRSAGALFAVAALAAMIGAFAIGSARAQPVTPPITQPPPTFNPSSPNTVPQPPYVPVAPATPGAVSGSSPAPQVVAPPPSVDHQPTHEAAKAAPSPAHVRHHGKVRGRWSRRRRRSRALRVAGPSYYPGLGEFYPPYPDPCHFRQVWSGPMPGEWTYTCSW